MPSPFIPKHHRDWKPEHMRGKMQRHCHWCAKGPFPRGEMIQVLESPMRWWFCKQECLVDWTEQRHDEAVVAWLRLCAGDRAQILKDMQEDAKPDAVADVA